MYLFIEHTHIIKHTIQRQINQQHPNQKQIQTQQIKIKKTNTSNTLINNKSKHTTHKQSYNINKIKHKTQTHN